MIVGNAAYWWNPRANSGRGARYPVARCAVTQYQTNAGSRKYSQNAVCRNLTPCGVGQYINQPDRNPTADRTPGDSVCEAVSTCNTSTYWANKDGATSTSAQFRDRYVDRECKTCPAGFAAAEENAEECVCSVCPAGEYQLGECRINPNGRVNTHICVPLTVCSRGQFETRAATRTSDRTCIGCRSCPAGSFNINTCAGENAAELCTPHQTCAAGSYSSKAGTSTTDVECTPYTVCGPGTYLRELGTASSDNVCWPVALSPPCQANEFEPAPPAATAIARTCQPVQMCAANERETTAPTPTSDRGCAQCAPCPAGTFESTQCTASSPNVCTACTVCADLSPTGQRMQSACTQREDRTCAPVVGEEPSETPKIKTVEGVLLVNGVDIVGENAYLKATVQEMERAEQR